MKGNAAVLPVSAQDAVCTGGDLPSPHDWWDRNAGSTRPRVPEVRLWAAILESAWLDLHHPLGRIRRDAEQYFREGDGARYAAETCGLDPAALLRAVEARIAAAPPIAKGAWNRSKFTAGGAALQLIRARAGARRRAGRCSDCGHLASRHTCGHKCRHCECRRFVEREQG